MGFIKILRWRLGGALSRLHRPMHPIEIGSLQRAAVFLAVMGREHASMLFDYFSVEEARSLSAQMNEFSQYSIDDDLLREVLEEFLDGYSAEPLPSYVALQELDEVARARVRAHPERAADRIRGLWMADEFDEEEDEDEYLEIGYDALDSVQKAAVFMMWLPPELSAMVFGEMPPRQIHNLTAAIIELPFVVPEAREVVLADFMEGVSLGIPGLTIGDVGLPIVVEAFVRSSPDSVARRLEDMWLEQMPHKKVEPAVSPAARLTPVEKCAVFFQSLSLPLAHKLLSAMEENEVETVLSTVEDLNTVDTEVRKAVLEELMSSTRGQMHTEADEPVQVWVKVMGQMIRKRPEVVVNQIRKFWLDAG